MDITELRPTSGSASGIVLVPEGRRLFPSMTVEENLQVGAANRRAGSWTIDRVYDLFPWMRGPAAASGRTIYPAASSRS